MAEIPDEEQHVIAAAYHLVKALEATKNFSDDMRTVLADLDIHFSTMIGLDEDEADDTREVEGRLMRARHTILSLHSNQSKICDSNPLTDSKYVQAVSDVRRLFKILGNMPIKRSSRSKDLFDRAQSILQMAMDRLQDELIHILVQNKDILVQNKEFFCDESPIFEDLSVAYEDDLVGNAAQTKSSGRETEEYVMNLIHPDVIPQIKAIATIMFDSGYDKEFCQVFTAFWRDTLAEYLMIHDVGKFSIEDVLQMEWNFLCSSVRKWRLAINDFIHVYLASAKRLFDHIAGEYGCSSSSCLVDASKGPLMFLLNFGQAVSIGPHKPELLFCLLYMYEVLEALAPEVDALFPEGIGSSIKIKFHELLTRLKDSSKAICKELGDHIASCSSTTPFPDGGIHPLTKYVMNYILCLPKYGDSLKLLLQDGENSDFRPNHPCAVATRLHSWTLILEANLEKSSDLYIDCSLKDIFMMNNIHYMVEKIRNSELTCYFGEEWIQNHIRKFRQHAACYERVTWSSILASLHVPRKAGKGKATLRARSRAFTTAFEDVYKNQTRWCVPDLRLREDLRISASMKVIQAYRPFVIWTTHHIGKKHIKYTEQDLETYILDLLEGSSKSLNRSWKRRMWKIFIHSS